MYTAFTPSHRGGAGPPLVLIHGFQGTWRTWELVLPYLERRHEVLAVTLPGHAGGPPLEGELSASVVPDAVERAIDAAGFDTAHIVGNSLGGYVALQLAARGRADSVVALAPAGGWARGDESFKGLLALQAAMHGELQSVAPHAHEIARTASGRRMVTQLLATNYDHIPAELIAHQIRGAAGCDGSVAMAEFASRNGWSLSARSITCPVRIIWGTDDRMLPWPGAALRYLHDWLPHADWVELPGVGHCPQLDVPLETAQLILGFTSPT